MDIPNEFIVKKEPDDIGIDVNVEIEVLEQDWCMDSGGKTDLPAGEEILIEDEQLDNMMSHSLFQHNLTQLFVPSDVPAAETDLANEALDTTNTRDIKDIMIKCEVVECDTEFTDRMPETGYKKDYLVENNNNLPITKQNHQCHICFKVFNYKHWHAHMNEVHSTITIQCKFCKKDYKSKKSLRKHSCSAKKDKKPLIKKKSRPIVGIFKCRECNDVFNTKDCMQKHVKNVHSKPVNCEICNSRLGSEVYLAAHMRRVHYDDGKVHSCEICGKIFKSPRYVRVHMKNTHNKNRGKKVRKDCDRVV